MDELQSLTLTAAFLAAVVVAGLSLSLVPNVELVTLVVFAAGMVLGAGRGALVGAVGMVLYVLANSAMRGFPPSPLPLLAAQGAGMSLAGVAGALWRGVWLRGGRARTLALTGLPVVGLLLSLMYQILVNLVSAVLWSGGDRPFLVFFWSGLAFAGLHIVSNALVFLFAGPPVVMTLRRAARARGWWKTVACIVALTLVGTASAQTAPDSTAASGASAPAAVDSTSMPDETPPPAGELVPPPRVGPGGSRPLVLAPEPVWRDRGRSDADEEGLPSYLATAPLDAQDLSRSTSRTLIPTGERWALGWGRTRMEYDGLPLNGPVHAFAEPPDVPQAWMGSWSERWSATGTRLALHAPPRLLDRPVSRISLSTGSYGQRAVEFGLFRNLGPVNLGANLTDQEQDTDPVFNDLDATRLWFHLDAAAGRLPNWSFDWSDGRRKSSLHDGSTYEQNSRRVQASLRGPLLGGETRFSGQYRRQSLKVSRQDEVRWDGFTLQGEWAAPVGVQTRFRWDRDRRRGQLAEARTLDGGRAEATWAGDFLGMVWGADMTLGHQEPFGTLLEGGIQAGKTLGSWDVTLGWSRQEGIPAIVDILDRPLPEAGLPDYLETVETVTQPERARGFRGEVGYTRNRFSARAGAWAVRQTGYLIESNPLWTESIGSAYTPVFEIRTQVVIHGGYGSVDIPLFAGLSVDGTARIHDRGLQDVPYLPEWTARGAAHWRKRLFRGTLDFDLEAGGEVMGERMNPGGEVYPWNSIGYVRATGAVDNGHLSLAFRNPVDAAVEADFRASDAVTPLLVPRQIFVLTLSLYLFD